MSQEKNLPEGSAQDSSETVKDEKRRKILTGTAYTAAGIGLGGALGVTAGFKLGSGLVIALEGATLSSSLETAVFWLPTIFMGIGLSAAGGYAGRRLSMWVKDRYGNDEE